MGDHLFDPASGGQDFLAFGQGGARKNCDRLEGGNWNFFALHTTENFPKRAVKHLFYMFQGVLAHYVFSHQIYARFHMKCKSTDIHVIAE